jgi:pimeloyl-ACP methyl ester carboxylesterase
VVVDLPGHGRSRLNGRFSFYRAADAIEEVLAHTGIDRPTMVGHSMGGAVALETIRQVGADRFSGLILLASSAYWVRPRLWVTLAAAPVVMGPRSPVLIRRQHAELLERPEDARRIVWEYDSRPDRRILDDTARALRNLDARAWPPMDLPPAVWLVTTRDGVISPSHQRISAQHFGVPTVDIDAEHAAVTQAPGQVLDAIEAATAAWDPHHISA